MHTRQHICVRELRTELDYSLVCIDNVCMDDYLLHKMALIGSGIRYTINGLYLALAKIWMMYRMFRLNYLGEVDWLVV